MNADTGIVSQLSVYSVQGVDPVRAGVVTAFSFPCSRPACNGGLKTGPRISRITLIRWQGSETTDQHSALIADHCSLLPGAPGPVPGRQRGEPQIARMNADTGSTSHACRGGLLPSPSLRLQDRTTDFTDNTDTMATIRTDQPAFRIGY